MTEERDVDIWICVYVYISVKVPGYVIALYHLRLL